MREAQNFFKHAENDHNSTFEFDPSETEALAFWAVMNASEVAPLSLEGDIYQLCYIAARSSFKDVNKLPLREAIELFGDLRSVSRSERLLAGKKVLINECANSAHV